MGRKFFKRKRRKVISTFVMDVRISEDCLAKMEAFKADISKELSGYKKDLAVQEIAEDFYYGHINEAEFRQKMLKLV